MSLVTLVMVAGWKGIAEAALPANSQEILDAAENACAAEIHAETLAQATYTEEYVFNAPATMMPLRLGPLFSLTSLSLNGTALSMTSEPGTNIFVDSWWVKYRSGYALSDVAIAVYKGGWVDDTELPAQVRDAIFHAFDRTVVQQASAGGVVSERIGDYAVNYALDLGLGSEAALPAVSRNLLRRYRRPEMALGG